MQAGMANRICEIEDFTAMAQEQELKAIERREMTQRKYMVKNSD
jgi:hypothetical protein